MRTAGLTLDDHMLYTIFFGAFPAEYEVEARNVVSRDSIGRDDIIKAVRERHHRLSENRKKGSNAGHAGPAMFDAAAAGHAGHAMVDGGGGGREKCGGGGGHGRVEAAAEEKVDVGHIKDDAAKAPTRSVVARPWLPVAMAPAPKPPKVVPPRRDATGVTTRAIGRPAARRSYAADVKDGGTLSMSAPRPRRSDAAVATDGGTLLMSTPHRKRKLSWRCRTTTVMKVRSRFQLSRPKKQANTVMFGQNGGRGVGLAGRR